MIILLILSILPMLCVLPAKILGYTLIVNFTLYGILLDVLSLTALILSVKKGKLAPVALHVLVPIAMFFSGLVIILFNDSVIDASFTGLTFFAAIVLSGVSAVMAIKTQGVVPCIIAGVLSGILALVFLQASLFILAMGFGVSSEKVLVSKISPQKSYRAEIVVISDGALGGDTIVRVNKTDPYIDCILFKLKKDYEIVFSDDWNKSGETSIEWVNERCLKINDAEFIVK